MTVCPKWNLLLASARACHAASEAATIEPDGMHLAEWQATDWDALLKLASRHGMVPLLARFLQQRAGDVPPDVLAKLQMQFRMNAARNGQLLEELSGLLRQFEAHGIAAVPYKGPALAAQVYGDLTLRACGDLDILLRPGDVLRAKALLLAAGYQPVQQFQTAQQEQQHLQTDCEYNFCRPTDGILVELHWRFRPQFFPLPLNMERLWERTQPAALGEARTLAPEDLLLILCVHGAKHCWERLCWICDIAALLRAFPNLDWELAWTQAQSVGCGRVLLLGLALAQELLGATLPAPAPRKMPGAVAALAAEVQRQLAQTDPAESDPHRRMLFHLRVRDRLRDRVPYVQHHVRRQIKEQIEEWKA